MFEAFHGNENLNERIHQLKLCLSESQTNTKKHAKSCNFSVNLQRPCTIYQVVVFKGMGRASKSQFVKTLFHKIHP